LAYRRVDFANCANLKNLRDQLQRRLLGILGIQLAQKLGYKVAAIEHGPEDSVLAKKLGASAYIDSAAKKTQQQSYRNSLAGTPFLPARPQPESNVLDARRQGHHGRCRRRPEPIEVSPAQLIFGRKNIRGWPSAILTNWEDTLRFAELTGSP
jgi:D-arabinose 1-dehydrogenase-like Zn-dependent alcohol dehydrogenase